MPRKKVKINISPSFLELRNPDIPNLLTREYLLSLESLQKKILNIQEYLSRHYRSHNYFNQEIPKKGSSFEIEYRNQNVLKFINNTFKFTRVFSTKGVQGIVGFIKFLDTTMVFKISTDVNRSTEHEYQILKTLSSTRSYLPHFNQVIGMIQMPITTKFLNDSENNDPVDQNFTDITRAPKNVLLLEYVNKLPLYRLIRKCTNKNLIISEISMLLISLDIGQYKFKYVNYDLHMGNILIQKCELNSVFLYHHIGKYYALPTYGFYPMIIDNGLSYVSNIEGKPMYCKVDHNNDGFQTTEFDPLNDTHHLLLSLLYVIETESDGFDTLSNQIKYIFRHIPALRKTGWKKLPNSPTKLLLSKLQDKCLDYDIFIEFEREFLEILNNLVTLPLKNYGNSEISDCFSAFMNELHKMCSVDDYYGNDILIIIQEIVDSIIEYRDEYLELALKNDSRREIIKEFKNRIIERTSSIIHEYIEYDYILERGGKNYIDYEKLLVSGMALGERLSSNYNKWIGENIELIYKCYQKTVVKSPLDVCVYLLRNMTCYAEIDNETIVYLWDSDNEKQNKAICNKLSSKSLQTLKSLPLLDKGKYLHDLLF